MGKIREMNTTGHIQAEENKKEGVSAISENDD